MAPKRWDSEKWSRPRGTFWKALSGQLASQRAAAFWVALERLALRTIRLSQGRLGAWQASLWAAVLRKTVLWMHSKEAPELRTGS